MHTSKQCKYGPAFIALTPSSSACFLAAFICNFPGCAKRFGLMLYTQVTAMDKHSAGVGSNLQRHKQVAHGIRRARRDRSVLEYKFKFEPLSLSPTLISDTTPMASEIAWDNEGPFSRRSVHWPGLQTVCAHYDRCDSLSILMSCRLRILGENE